MRLFIMPACPLVCLRPYYLNVDDAGNGERTIKYSAEDSALFLDQSAIISGGGFGKGLGMK